MVQALFTEILLSDILCEFFWGMGEILLSGNENRRQTGARYEKLAAEYLEKQGLFILERNYRCRQGIEKGTSLEAINRRKQKRICRAAGYYLVCEVGSMDVSCRFDAVGIDGKEEKISWIKNAFDFCL